jgi:pilus assembly protein Flp/PilA
MKLMEMFRAFARDEEGIALTEYLILLGLLTAAVIAAVLSIGEDLGTAWGTWETWFGSADLDAPAVAPAPST